jgi:hypothetical protein
MLGKGVFTEFQAIGEIRRTAQPTAVTYAECPELTFGKITSLPSVLYKTHDKLLIRRVYFFDTR